jgi:hypothetical protein
MKRPLFIFACLLFLIGITALYAQEQEIKGGPQVLIDFSNLKGTEVDFSKYPGAAAEGVKEILVDLSIPNWGVELASSSASPENKLLSFTKPVQSRKMQGEVLGARIHFPTAPFNSWAKIVPPFDIPFYEDAEGDEPGAGTKFINKGVLRNVGTIKYITARITGRMFPHGLTLTLKDEQENAREMFLGYLDFDGWRTMRWDNPNYISDVKMRDLRRTPLYPESMPSIKFDSFTVYRHASQIGGDFVIYIKDVQMVYDLAVIEYDRDINDEAIWRILQTRRDAKRAAEMRRLGILQLLRKQEALKMQHAVVESQ